MSELLTVREAAARLKLSTATVYRLCQAGGLQHVRISNAVRISEAAIAAFIASRQRR